MPSESFRVLGPVPEGPGVVEVSLSDIDLVCVLPPDSRKLKYGAGLVREIIGLRLGIEPTTVNRNDSTNVGPILYCDGPRTILFTGDNQENIQPPIEGNYPQDIEPLSIYEQVEQLIRFIKQGHFNLRNIGIVTDEAYDEEIVSQLHSFKEQVPRVNFYSIPFPSDYK